jgi:hypothetical protein
MVIMIFLKIMENKKMVPIMLPLVVRDQGMI